MYEIEETSTSNNIGSTESFINNDDDLFPNSLLTSSLNSVDKTNAVFFSTIENTDENTIINSNSPLFLLWFSHLTTSDLVLSFYIHFALLNGYLSSNILKFSIQITYNYFLRILENLEANCDLVNSKVNNIKIIPEFNFILDRLIINISSITNYYIDNIQQISNKNNNLLDSNIFFHKFKIK